MHRLRRGALHRSRRPTPSSPLRRREKAKTAQSAGAALFENARTLGLRGSNRCAGDQLACGSEGTRHRALSERVRRDGSVSDVQLNLGPTPKREIGPTHAWRLEFSDVFFLKPPFKERIT